MQFLKSNELFRLTPSGCCYFLTAHMLGWNKSSLSKLFIRALVLSICPYISKSIFPLLQLHTVPSTFSFCRYAFRLPGSMVMLSYIAPKKLAENPLISNKCWVVYALIVQCHQAKVSPCFTFFPSLIFRTRIVP